RDRNPGHAISERRARAAATRALRIPGHLQPDVRGGWEPLRLCLALDVRARPGAHCSVDRELSDRAHLESHARGPLAGAGAPASRLQRRLALIRTGIARPNPLPSTRLPS